MENWENAEVKNVYACTAIRGQRSHCVLSCAGFLGREYMHMRCHHLRMLFLLMMIGVNFENF